MVRLSASPDLVAPAGVTPSRFATSGRPFTPRPTFHTLDSGTQLFRLYRPSPFAPTPTTWRFFGPRARFDHQRGDGGSAPWVELPDEDAVPLLTPADDAERGILYAAFTLSCCVVEVFDAFDFLDPCGWEFVRLTSTRELKLLDLRGKGAMGVGTVAALSKRRHAMAQAWSRYFYEDSAFDNVDGLIYNGAHNDERALALYERASDGLRVTLQTPLESRRLRRRLLQVAEDHNLALDLAYLASR